MERGKKEDKHTHTRTHNNTPVTKRQHEGPATNAPNEEENDDVRWSQAGKHAHTHTQMKTHSQMKHLHAHTQKATVTMTNTNLNTSTYPVQQTHEYTHIYQPSQTFMMKKSSRMTKMLTSGCSQAPERPRPTGRGDPEIFVQVKLSKRELIHSLGISWRWEEDEDRERNEKQRK